MREKTFSAMLAMDDDLKPEDAFLFINSKSKKQYEQEFERYKSLSDEQKKDKAIMDLRSYLSVREFTGLSEVHPGWMWEVLKNEPPRIISVILRYLSSSHTKYLIEYMPSSLRQKLPPPVDAFRVPPEIISIIRSKFQDKFLPMFAPRGVKDFNLEHLPFLSLHQIQTVFKKRGLVELALALHDMPKQAHKVVMNRLSLDEANVLKQYFESLADEFSKLKKNAKFAVLEAESSDESNMGFIENLGMRGIARGVVNVDNWVFLVRQKLEPKDGYLWQRYVEEGRSLDANISSLERKLADKIIVEVSTNKNITN